MYVLYSGKMLQFLYNKYGVAKFRMVMLGILRSLLSDIVERRNA